MDPNEADAIYTAEVLIEDLCDLLDKQTSMAIRGDLVGVEALVSDAEDLMHKISELKVADSPSLIEKKKFP